MMHDDLNRIIVQGIGLTVNSQQKIVDQDTGEQLRYKDKNLRYSSNNSVMLTKQDAIFDPAENRGQMVALFNHYSKKLEEEDNVYIKMSYEVQQEDNKSSLVVEMDGQKIETGSYYNDSLKYVEAIERMNGTEDVSFLQQYDKKKDFNKQTSKSRKKKKSIFG